MGELKNSDGNLDMTNTDPNYASANFKSICSISLEQGLYIKETDALFGMMSLISKNGNFILGACQSANDGYDEGRNGTFLEALYQKSPNKEINIYGCIDNNSKPESTLNYPMPGPSIKNPQGWGYCGFSTGGKFIKVTESNPNLTGRLILNSPGAPFSFETKK